jgi:hypothetical protein
MVGFVHRRSGHHPSHQRLQAGYELQPSPSSIRILFPNQDSSCHYLKWRVQQMLGPLGLRSRNVRLAVTTKALRSRTTLVMFSRSREDMQQNDSLECHLSWLLAHPWIIKSAEG